MIQKFRSKIEKVFLIDDKRKALKKFSWRVKNNSANTHLKKIVYKTKQNPFLRNIKIICNFFVHN